MRNARIRKVIIGVHMGLGHDGLAKLLAKKPDKGGADLDVSQLAQGDLVLCMNSHGDKMKVLGSKGLVIGYLKLPNKQRIMGEALRYIPMTFGAEGFNYDEACRIALREKLSLHTASKLHMSPLDAAKAVKAAGV